MDAQNYYDFLGINQDANEAQILKAIANIEKKDQDGRHASRLLTIKRTLTDANRRRIYDRMVKQSSPAKSIDTIPDIRSQVTAAQTDSHASDTHSTGRFSSYTREVARASSSSNAKSAEYVFTPTYQPLSRQTPTDAPEPEPTHAPPRYHKDRITAAWLAFFSFGFGVHRFWLGQPKLGVLYFFFNALTSGLLSIAGIIEGVILFFAKEEDWRGKHGDKSSPYPGKDKVAASLLAFMAGSVGAHRYYLGQWQLGILYTIFSFTLIPWLIAIFEGISYLNQSDAQWNVRYGEVPNRPAGCFTVIFIPLILTLLGLTIFASFVMLLSDK